jgi:cytoskeletal protein CcmA (bactofilin family)
MLEIPASQPSNQRNAPSSTFTPSKNVGGAMEQGTIGPSIVIKGEISGTEPLYIDGRIEGKINFGSSRVTVGRSGQVAANITAKELVVMGTVKGNVECSERLDMRAEGSLTGDVVTRLISVEAGAVMKGSIEVRQKQQKEVQKEDKVQLQTKPPQIETPKALPATAGA